MFSQKEKYAELYLKQGWSIIPIRDRAKTPLLEWKKFTQERPSIETVKDWILQWPDCNFGIVTGEISNLIVVDLDGEEGIAEAQKYDLNSPITCLTGKGRHLYYKWIPKIQNSVKIKPGIDIRSDNGFVMAPPSIHPNGMRYRWFTPISVDTVRNLPLFPATLFAKSALNTVITEKSGNKEDWIAEALKEMKDGNIDDTLFKICSKLRATGFSRGDALVLLSPHAERVGAEDGHLEAKIENVWKRYEPNANISSISRRDNAVDNGLSIHSPTNSDSWKQFEQRGVEAVRGDVIKTGYTKLDQMLQGGLHSERLFTVAALTNHGKTNFAIGLAKNLCEADKTVLYFSTEYTYAKVWQRYIATLKDPNSFRKHKLHVCDGFAPNLEQVEEAVKQLKPDVFIFDYIQHIGKDKDVLNTFMKGCQLIQRNYNCQGIILSQLNRTADWMEDGKRVMPRMSMLEGSATLEQASSRVLLLSLMKIGPEYNELVGVLDKNDDGDTGMVTFGLYKNPWRIEEL